MNHQCMIMNHLETHHLNKTTSLPARKTYYEAASLPAHFAYVSTASCHRHGTDRQESPILVFITSRQTIIWILVS